MQSASNAIVLHARTPGVISLAHDLKVLISRLMSVVAQKMPTQH